MGTGVVVAAEAELLPGKFSNGYDLDMRCEFVTNADYFANAEQIPVIARNRSHVMASHIGGIEEVEPHLATGDTQELPQRPFDSSNGKMLKQIVDERVVKGSVIQAVSCKNQALVDT